MAGAGRLWPLEFPALTFSLALDPRLQRLPSSAHSATAFAPQQTEPHLARGGVFPGACTVSCLLARGPLAAAVWLSDCPSLTSGPCFPAGRCPPASRALLSARRAPPPFAVPTFLSAPSFPFLLPSHLDQRVHPETPRPWKAEHQPGLVSQCKWTSAGQLMPPGSVKSWDFGLKETVPAVTLSR